MKVVFFSAGMPVTLFESDDIDAISFFLSSNRANYPQGLFVDFGNDVFDQSDSEREVVIA